MPERHELRLPAADLPGREPGTALSVFGYDAALVTAEEDPEDPRWVNLTVDVDVPEDHPSPVHDPGLLPPQTAESVPVDLGSDGGGAGALVPPAQAETETAPPVASQP
jgi:hypothetical protein